MDLVFGYIRLVIWVGCLFGYFPGWTWLVWWLDGRCVLVVGFICCFAWLARVAEFWLGVLLVFGGFGVAWWFP